MFKKLALLLGTTLLLLFVLEVAARLNLMPMPEFVVSNAWWEERWHRERRGLNPREFVELDSDLGFVPAANLRDVEYEDVLISTNSDGMRGVREYPVERTDAARVVAIGDSFVFGQCVEDDETFPAVMERVMPDTEVLNLGVMGYGQDQALLRLRKDGFRYDPDAVVFGFHMTDMRRNLMEFRGYAKPRFRMKEDGSLEVANVPVPMPEEFTRLWPPRLWNFVRIYRDAVDHNTPEQRQQIHDLSRAIVRQMGEDTRARGIPLLMVHLPHPAALSSDDDFGWPWLEEICQEEARPGQFLCASPVPRFREIAPTEQAVRHHFDCHFSAELQQALGELIADKLAAELPEVFAPRRARADS